MSFFANDDTLSLDCVTPDCSVEVLNQKLYALETLELYWQCQFLRVLQFSSRPWSKRLASKGRRFLCYVTLHMDQVQNLRTSLLALTSCPDLGLLSGDCFKTCEHLVDTVLPPVVTELHKFFAQL